MKAETNLQQLLQKMNPVLNKGEYVFCLLKTLANVDLQDVLFFFREDEGSTILVTKAYADKNQFAYDYVAAWITLNVYSSLQAVGLTAAFSNALASNNISCNVVAAYNHDHIFVTQNDGLNAMEILKELASSANS